MMCLGLSVEVRGVLELSLGPPARWEGRVGVPLDNKIRKTLHRWVKCARASSFFREFATHWRAASATKGDLVSRWRVEVEKSGVSRRGRTRVVGVSDLGSADSQKVRNQISLFPDFPGACVFCVLSRENRRFPGVWEC